MTDESPVFLVLKDGTKLRGSTAGYFAKKLRLYLKDKTFQDAMQLAMNVGNLLKIDFSYGSLMNRYTGFDTVLGIEALEDGTVLVTLTGEHIEVENELPSEWYPERIFS